MSDTELADQVVELVHDIAELLHHTGNDLRHASQALQFGNKRSRGQVAAFLDVHGGYLASVANQLGHLQTQMVKEDLQRSLDQLLNGKANDQ